MKNIFKILCSILCIFVFFFVANFVFAQQEVIKIGIILPLSGNAAWVGEDGNRGVQLALDEWNEKGGIEGKKIKAIIEDDGGVAKTGLTAFQKLVNVDKVQFIGGGIFSSVALVGAPLCRENKVVYIAPLASNPYLLKPGGYVYRLVTSDNINGNVAAKFAYNILNKRKAASLATSSDYGVSVQRVLENKFMELGGEFVCKELYESNALDYRTQLTKIASNNPDVLFSTASDKEAATFLRQMEEMKLKNFTIINTMSMLEDPKFVELAGTAAEGVYYVVDAFETIGGIEKAEEFMEKIRDKFGIEAGMPSKYMYDVVNLGLTAIQNGGNIGSEINKYISTVKDFQGVTGNINFTLIGDRIVPITIRKISDGKFVDTGYIDLGD